MSYSKKVYLLVLMVFMAPVAIHADDTEIY